MSYFTFLTAFVWDERRPGEAAARWQKEEGRLYHLMNERLLSEPVKGQDEGGDVQRGDGGYGLCNIFLFNW